MTTQILKDKIPSNVLYDFCDKNNVFENQDYYVINKASFKKSIFNNSLDEFKEDIKPHYHKSKLYYVERELNYPKFITLLRQICKCNHISYTSKIQYNKSTYDIIYYFYKTK